MLEMENPLPEEVVEVFEEETPNAVSVRAASMSGPCIILEEAGDEYPIEFARSLVERLMQETDYVITGLREGDGKIRLWLDEYENGVSKKFLSVAQRAARCLDHKENDTQFKPNFSSESKEQYVDVYPDPHERASEDFSIRPEDFDRLEREGLKIRTMSCGRDRGHGTETYRIWFAEVEE